MIRTKIAALLLLAALPALAEDAKPACILDPAAVIQRESGGRTFRVIREAISRSGRHAIAWALVEPKDENKIEARDGEQFAPDANIDNVLSFGFHTRVMGFLPVATHDFGELRCESRRITLVLDLRAAYKRLKARGNWLYRYLTAPWNEALHRAMVA